MLGSILVCMSSIVTNLLATVFLIGSVAGSIANAPANMICQTVGLGVFFTLAPHIASWLLDRVTSLMLVILDFLLPNVSRFLVCLVPALGRAILGVCPVGVERFITLPAHSQGILYVNHLEREQKTHRQHQRMEIPHNNRMVLQFQMIGGRISIEAGKTSAVQIQRILIQPIASAVIHVHT